MCGTVEGLLRPGEDGIAGTDSGDDWLRVAPILASVANLGRSLTPPAGDDAAQSGLLGYQRQLPRDLFLQVTRSGLPLTASC